MATSVYTQSVRSSLFSEYLIWSIFAENYIILILYSMAAFLQKSWHETVNFYEWWGNVNNDDLKTTQVV